MNQTIHTFGNLRNAFSRKPPRITLLMPWRLSGTAATLICNAAREPLAGRFAQAWALTQNPFTQRPVRGLRGRPRRSLARRLLLAIALLSPGLTGCILTAEKSDPALDLPASYRYGRGNPNAALPKLEWWRGFRSRELTDLM